MPENSRHKLYLLAKKLLNITGDHRGQVFTISLDLRQSLNHHLTPGLLCRGLCTLILLLDP